MKKRVWICLIAGIFACTFVANSAYAKSIEDTIQSLESQIELADGERLVNDTIIGKEQVVIALRDYDTARKGCPNFVRSNEHYQLRYDAVMQFTPSYKTRPGDGSDLEPGRQVKQGWIDYRRNGKSVIGGTRWTKFAHSKNSNETIRVRATAFDDVVDWGVKGRTTFHFNWFYFSK